MEKQRPNPSIKGCLTITAIVVVLAVVIFGGWIWLAAERAGRLGL